MMFLMLNVCLSSDVTTILLMSKYCRCENNYGLSKALVMLMSLVIYCTTLNIDISNFHLYTRKQETNISNDLACSWQQFFILMTVIFLKTYYFLILHRALLLTCKDCCTALFHLARCSLSLWRCDLKSSLCAKAPPSTYLILKMVSQ